MRIRFVAAAVLALTSAASAEELRRSTAIFVSPIHEAQVVRGDDGMDHVEYELLVTNVFVGPVTLASVAVLDGGGKELMRIEGDRLAAATQTLLAQTKTAVIPASAAASVDIDLILPPDTVPERVTHRIAYALAPDADFASIIGSLQVDGPVVAVDRRPAIVIKPPLTGKGWLAANGCCKPNIHRDTRLAIDGLRIETPETFAIDWVRVENGSIFTGDGKQVGQHHAFGADVLAVADGTVVSIRDGMPEESPFLPATAVHAPEDYGGNHVILEIGASVFVVYAHLQPGSLTVKVGDAVKSGALLGKLGNSGNSTAPHLHFGIHDKPDFLAGRSLPFVFDSFTVADAVDTSVEDRPAIQPDGRPVRSAYPLYGGIHDYP